MRGNEITRSIRRALVGAVSVLGVLSAPGGCAVGPDFVKPEAAVNKTWQGKNDPRIATQAAVDSLWWKEFRDPVLDHLVELAYRQNLPLQVTGLRIVEARAQLGISIGMLFPQQQTLSAGADWLGVSKNAPSFAAIDRHFWDYQVGFDAAWELDFWGKYRRGVQADAAGLLASVADYYSAIVSLTAEVARTYAVIRTYEVLIEQAWENARVQEQSLRIAESRFKNGATSELDVTQASALFESTRATIPELQISLQQARNALATLLGQPSGTVDTLLIGRQEIPTAPARVAVGVPGEMLRRRPDIRGAELSAAAQCARIGVAKADLFPSLAIVGSFGFEASTAGNLSRNPFSADGLFWSIGPRIVWPFFNYGRITNNVRVQDARFQQLLVNYRDTVLKAAQEVEDAMVGFLKAQDALVFTQNAAKAAQRSVEIAVVQYREGAVDYQRVLDAQRSLLDQQNNLARTRSSIVTYLIALYKALGGGWELRRGDPVVPWPMQKEMKARTGWGHLLSRPRRPEMKDKH